MKLTTEKPGMFLARKLNYLDKLPVRRDAAKNQTCAFQSLAKLRIKLVTMPVSLANLFGSVDFLRQRTRRDVADPGAQAHRSAKLFNVYQVPQFKDNRVRSITIKLG